LNCAVLGEAIAEAEDVCDIGSGAGLPGLVLALSRPDLTVTLVEPLLRRTTFLQEAVQELELGNVEVVRARAEELHGQREFSVVTSRAVAPLERLLGWSMPLVRRGGAMVVMKGASVHDEIEAAAATLRRYQAGAVTVSEYGTDKLAVPTTVLRVEATGLSRLGLDAQRSAAGDSRPARRSRRRRKGS
jgi:16S rRNA (guanine527-N7)-methyltransferase